MLKYRSQCTPNSAVLYDHLRRWKRFFSKVATPLGLMSLYTGILPQSHKKKWLKARRRSRLGAVSGGAAICNAAGHQKNGLPVMSPNGRSSTHSVERCLVVGFLFLVSFRGKQYPRGICIRASEHRMRGGIRNPYSICNTFYILPGCTHQLTRQLRLAGYPWWVAWEILIMRWSKLTCGVSVLSCTYHGIYICHN